MSTEPHPDNPITELNDQIASLERQRDDLEQQYKKERQALVQGLEQQYKEQRQALNQRLTEARKQLRHAQKLKPVVPMTYIYIERRPDTPHRFTIMNFGVLLPPTAKYLEFLEAVPLKDRVARKKYWTEHFNEEKGTANWLLLLISAI